jgi:hemoglobin-like flavoprotein
VHDGCLGRIHEQLDTGFGHAPDFEALGAQEMRRGIPDEIFDCVGDALFYTIAKLTRYMWTDEIADAWRQACAEIAGALRRGAETARALN